MTEGDRIRLIRLAKGMNQVEFAREVDMTASAISQLESGIREMTENTRQNLCSRLQLNPTWLMTGEGEIDLVPEEPDELMQEVAKILSANPSLHRALKALTGMYSAEDWKRLNSMIGERFLVTSSSGPDFVTIAFTLGKRGEQGK